jgi:tetratricopeptide (TPR) repeat protein
VSESLDQEIRTLQSIYWSERDPDGFAFASLADAFRRRGKIRDALDLLTDGTSRHPEFATGHVVTARLYMEQGMHAEAEFAARRVLDLDPGNIVGLATLATALHARGAAEEAGALRATLVELDPESEEARSVATLDLPEGTPDPEPSGALDVSPAVPAASESEREPVSPGYDEDDGLLLDALSLVSPVAGDHPDGQDDQLAQALEALGLEAEADAVGTAGGDLELLMPEPGADALVEDAWASAEPEDAIFDLGGLAPDGAAPLEADVLDLAALAPEPAAEPVEEVFGMAAFAPEPVADVLDLNALAPEPVAEPEEEIFDLGALAPEAVAEPEEEIFDMAAFAPEPVAELEEEIFDLAAFAPDPAEDVLDLAALAPEPAAESEGEVFDLGALAPEPEEPEEEDVLDLSALAPDAVAESEEDVFDMAAFAPEAVAELEDEVFDLSSLAPEPAAEVVDFGAFAPDPEPEFASLDDLAPSPAGSGDEDRDLGSPFETLVDLDALAPDPEPEFASLDDLGAAADLPTMAEDGVPDETDVVMDFGALAPEGAHEGEEKVEDAQPIYTRTLAELYVKQGFTTQAIEVFRHLLQADPTADDIRRRLAELEGGAPEPAPSRAESVEPESTEPEASTPDGDAFATIRPAEAREPAGTLPHGEEEVEKLARDLSESGAHLHDVDTPFAWTEESDSPDKAEDPDGISSWFDNLLEWGEREEP